MYKKFDNKSGLYQHFKSAYLNIRKINVRNSHLNEIRTNRFPVSAIILRIKNNFRFKCHVYGFRYNSMKYRDELISTKIVHPQTYLQPGMPVQANIVAIESPPSRVEGRHSLYKVAQTSFQHVTHICLLRCRQFHPSSTGGRSLADILWCWNYLALVG